MSQENKLEPETLSDESLDEARGGARTPQLATLERSILSRAGMGQLVAPSFTLDRLSVISAMAHRS